MLHRRLANRSFWAVWNRKTCVKQDVMADCFVDDYISDAITYTWVVPCSYVSIGCGYACMLMCRACNNILSHAHQCCCYSKNVYCYECGVFEDCYKLPYYNIIADNVCVHVVGDRFQVCAAFLVYCTQTETQTTGMCIHYLIITSSKQLLIIDLFGILVCCVRGMIHSVLSWTGDIHKKPMDLICHPKRRQNIPLLHYAGPESTTALCGHQGKQWCLVTSFKLFVHPYQCIIPCYQNTCAPSRCTLDMH